MNADEMLAEQFEAHRGHLRVVAYRMLGSVDEADDAVQEGWLRLSRSEPSEIDNLAGWLRTVVARVCLDMLRSRTARREETLDTHESEAVTADDDGGHPEREALLADSVGVAMMMVLDRLAPAERLAFVLHDMFAVPFDEIGSIMGRSPTAARQLASRGRRRVQMPGTAPDTERTDQRKVVQAFLAASRNGDFDALVGLLDPDAMILADGAAVRAGAESEVRGAVAVAGTFSGRARAAKLVLLDGFAGAVWAPGGRPRVVFGFTIEAGKIVEIELLADPEQLGRLDLAMVDD
jgi:RNA polymerase sigma factor (sigma-70 family)